MNLQSLRISKHQNTTGQPKKDKYTSHKIPSGSDKKVLYRTSSIAITTNISLHSVIDLLYFTRSHEHE